MFLEIIKMAFESLLANKTRSFLSMLGIIIGVSTIFAIFTLGQGARNAVDEQFEGLSANSVIVMSMNGRGSTASSKLKATDAETVAEESTYIATASGVLSGNASVSFESQEGSYGITGVNTNYFEISNIELDAGRVLKEAEVVARSRVAILGSVVAEELYEGTSEILGTSIIISGKKFEVIGIMKEKGAGMNSVDEKIVIPYSTAEKSVLGTNGRVMLNFQANSVDDIAVATEDIIRILREEHGLKSGQEDDFRILDAGSMVESAQDAAKMMSLFLTSIAAIALLVSGIGIMNVMFATVSERTREIGIAKAIGGKRKDILTQFLLESVVLSMIGGIIGVLIGNGLIYIVNKTPLAEFISLAPSPIGMVIGVGFSVLVGVFFGFYPALKASRLDPVDALRSE